MNNAELITELIYNALKAADKRIDGLQKLVDINTERCEALRKQLRESHEGYEKHINELTTKCNQLQAAVDNYEKRIEELMPKAGEWIEVHDWLHIPQEERGTYRCSACGQVMKYPWNYCPNCGCRMDGETK